MKIGYDEILDLCITEEHENNIRNADGDLEDWPSPGYFLNKNGIWERPRSYYEPKSLPALPREELRELTSNTSDEPALVLAIPCDAMALINFLEKIGASDCCVYADELGNQINPLLDHLNTDDTPPGQKQAQPENQYTNGKQSADSMQLTKRERQIRAIENAAMRLGYNAQQIPDGGKSALKEECKKSHPDIFGAGDDPFLDSWKEAVQQGRVRMKNHNTFSKR